jgi:hypothetical protein
MTYTMTELKMIVARLDEQIVELQRQKNNALELMKFSSQENGLVEHSDGKNNGITMSDKKSFLKQSHVEDVILGIEKNFSSQEIPNEIAKRYGEAYYGKTVIANSLNNLIKLKRIKYISRRSGQNPAIYSKT